PLLDTLSIFYSHPSPHHPSLSPYLPALSPLFFFNDTATTEIYTLSLHDALPILNAKATRSPPMPRRHPSWKRPSTSALTRAVSQDRKSTRLNSSHVSISYAVFCLKKKKKKEREDKYQA